MPDLDELYGLPLEEFVPARNVLARELRSAGKRDQAGEVAGLRKPSVAAWAVNQLVLTQRKAVEELFDAGDALRATNDQVLAGRGDAGSLRTALARERTAVDALTEAARGLLTSQGHELSPTIIDRVSDTLHAAALDDDARTQVREGRLERELRHVGLGMTQGGRGSGSPPARARRKAAAAKPEPKPEPVKDKAAEREARRRVERAARMASVARERREKAAQALQEAEEMLDSAERELTEAEQAVRDLAS